MIEKLSGVSDSVLSERCCTEESVLMTLDLDFANVQAYRKYQRPLLSGSVRQRNPYRSARVRLLSGVERLPYWKADEIHKCSSGVAYGKLVILAGLIFAYFGY